MSAKYNIVVPAPSQRYNLINDLTVMVSGIENVFDTMNSTLTNKVTTNTPAILAGLNSTAPITANTTVSAVGPRITQLFANPDGSAGIYVAASGTETESAIYTNTNSLGWVSNKPIHSSTPIDPKNKTLEQALLNRKNMRELFRVGRTSFPGNGQPPGGNHSFLINHNSGIVPAAFFCQVHKDSGTGQHSIVWSIGNIDSVNAEFRCRNLNTSGAAEKFEVQWLAILYPALP
jgi:hypothetical protein